MNVRRPYLYVTRFFPSPTNWRGAYSLDFVKALQKTGAFEVKVFVPGDGSDYEIDGVTVHTFRMRMLPSASFPFLFERRNQRLFLSRVRDVLGDAAQDVAVCHVNTPLLVSLALAARQIAPSCRTLLHHHCLGSDGLRHGRLCRFAWYRNLMRPAFNRRFEAMDAHVFISKACQSTFTAASGVEPARAIVLHNGVDVELFRPAEDARDSSAEKRRFVIGTVANFNRIKDYPTTARAIARLVKDSRDVTWRIAGTGEERGSFERLIGELGIRERVEFVGEMSHERLPDFYRSIDLFVLPSYWEGFGCVYTEAYACGVPFIACKTGNGIIDLVEERRFGDGKDENLWLIARGDDEGLARRIAHVMENRPRMTLTGEHRIDPLVEGFKDAVLRLTEGTAS